MLTLHKVDRLLHQFAVDFCAHLRGGAFMPCNVAADCSLDDMRSLFNERRVRRLDRARGQIAAKAQSRLV
jgi:hypothetical protein